MHFQKMIKIFYQLGVDPSLKPAFLSSLLKMLSDSAENYIHQRYSTILNASLGQIHQVVLLALEELCRKRKIIRQYLQGNTELEQACKRPKLEIKSKCRGCKPHKQSRKVKKIHHFSFTIYPISMQIMIF